jgi:cell division septation protein DedD
MVLLPAMLSSIMTAQAANPTAYLGLSGYPTSTSQVSDIIHVMDTNGLNIYRMSFNPEWMRGPHPYHAEYVQYFLDHSSYTIIVDRNHIYPPTEEGAQTARDNWNTARNSVLQVLQTWPNNPRVMVELVNEYVSSDFYSRMQSLVNEIRNVGYTNPIVVNKWNQPWTVINDPLNNVYQGYHFYFNTWSPSGAMSQINTALSRGIKIINTEVGADYNEYNSFTTATVDELNTFLTQCASLGVGNTVWMNENLNNLPRYQSLGLNFPPVSTQPKPSPNPSPTPSPSPSPTPTPTPAPPTPKPTPTPSAPPTPTPAPTSTPTPTPTPAPTPTPTPTKPGRGHNGRGHKQRFIYR